MTTEFDNTEVPKKNFSIELLSQPSDEDIARIAGIFIRGYAQPYWGQDYSLDEAMGVISPYLENVNAQVFVLRSLEDKAIQGFALTEFVPQGDGLGFITNALENLIPVPLKVSDQKVTLSVDVQTLNELSTELNEAYPVDSERKLFFIGEVVIDETFRTKETTPRNLSQYLWAAVANKAVELAETNKVDVLGITVNHGPMYKMFKRVKFGRLFNSSFNYNHEDGTPSGRKLVIGRFPLDHPLARLSLTHPELLFDIFRKLGRMKESLLNVLGEAIS